MKLAGQSLMHSESWPGEIPFSPGKRAVSAEGKYLHTADGFCGAAYQGHRLVRGEGNETLQLYLLLSLPLEH